MEELDAARVRREVHVRDLGAQPGGEGGHEGLAGEDGPVEGDVEGPGDEDEVGGGGEVGEGGDEVGEGVEVFWERGEGMGKGYRGKGGREG